jgi:lipopolysaccharide biosynthesis regulator YciM
MGYAAEGIFDAALDACLRAVEASPGSIDVHFTMAHLYLLRGWASHAVQRVRLIDHRLAIDADPRRRAALQALARDFRSLSPELEAIASASG